jgi:hypothetical protein
MTQNPARYAGESLETLIFTVRGKRVILDADLAGIYGVTTKRLNCQMPGHRLPDSKGKMCHDIVYPGFS